MAEGGGGGMMHWPIRFSEIAPDVDAGAGIGGSVVCRQGVPCPGGVGAQKKCFAVVRLFTLG